MAERSNRFYADLGKVYSDISFLRGFMIGGHWALDSDFGWRLDQSRRGVVFRDNVCYLMFAKNIDRGFSLLNDLRMRFIDSGIQLGGVRLMQVLDIRELVVESMPYDWVLYSFDESLLGDGLLSFYRGIFDYLVGEGMFAVDKISMDKYVRISSENRCKFSV